MAANWVVLMAVAAVSHAGWNFFLKQSKNKTVFLWSMRLWALVIFLAVGALLHPKEPPSARWLPWGAGSAVLHCLYSLLLIKSYERSDLALAYPIARGTAPLIVVAAGWCLLGERASLLPALGVIPIVAGIFLLYAVPEPGRTSRLLAAIARSPWPILTGVCIAGYTLFDKLAVARVPPVGLNVMQNIGQASVLGAIAFRREGAREVASQWRAHWPKMILSGFLVGLAYVLALVVMTAVPVSRVAPVRESSILCGAILGVAFLKEKLSRERILGAALVFLGVVLAAS